jgi:hypothetical protein
LEQAGAVDFVSAYEPTAVIRRVIRNARLRSRSCIVDGEAVACDEGGAASFDRIRHRHHDFEAAVTYSMIELKDNGDGIFWRSCPAAGQRDYEFTL